MANDDIGDRDSKPHNITADTNAPINLAAVTCPNCGERCNRMLWRSFPDDAKWISRCCGVDLPD